MKRRSISISLFTTKLALNSMMQNWNYIYIHCIYKHAHTYSISMLYNYYATCNHKGHIVTLEDLTNNNLIYNTIYSAFLIMYLSIILFNIKCNNKSASWNQSSPRKWRFWFCWNFDSNYTFNDVLHTVNHHWVNSYRDNNVC